MKIRANSTWKKSFQVLFLQKNYVLFLAISTNPNHIHICLLFLGSSHTPWQQSPPPPEQTKRPASPKQPQPTTPLGLFLKENKMIVSYAVVAIVFSPDSWGRDRWPPRHWRGGWAARGWASGAVLLGRRRRRSADSLAAGPRTEAGRGLNNVQTYYGFKNCFSQGDTWGLGKDVVAPAPIPGSNSFGGDTATCSSFLRGMVEDSTTSAEVLRDDVAEIIFASTAFDINQLTCRFRPPPPQRRCPAQIPRLLPSCR